MIYIVGSFTASRLRLTALNVIEFIINCVDFNSFLVYVFYIGLSHDIHQQLVCRKMCQPFLSSRFLTDLALSYLKNSSRKGLHPATFHSIFLTILATCHVVATIESKNFGSDGGLVLPLYLATMLEFFVQNENIRLLP